MGEPTRVVVVGGGASGLMAAGRAAELGADVILLEKTERTGKKILISGKRRCNLTNARPLDEFIAMFGANGRFLHGPFRRFFRDELRALLARYGVETKVEQGGRIYPVSEAAADVVAALESYGREHDVEVRRRCAAVAVDVVSGRVTGVRTEGGVVAADAVILGTGGASWPGTGSSGDGYRVAVAVGHTITPLRPALVPLAVRQVELAKSMQGVSLHNVRLTALALPSEAVALTDLPGSDVGGRGLGRKQARAPVIESRLGDMMCTHFGVGGPIVLLMSLAVAEALEQGPVSLALDLKPGLEERQLRQRLQRDLDSHGKRSYRRILEELLPHKLVEPFADLTGIRTDKPAHQVSAEERERLLLHLKALLFDVANPLPLSVAIVTAGGVSLAEVDPRTMQSRRVRGLYLCGEVLDLDADTGGYNLQAAFTTGYVAGESAAMAS